MVISIMENQRVYVLLLVSNVLLYICWCRHEYNDGRSNRGGFGSPPMGRGPGDISSRSNLTLDSDHRGGFMGFSRDRRWRDEESNGRSGEGNRRLFVKNVRA